MDDMSAYKSLFLAESRENLHSFSELIIGMEQDKADHEAINTLFRVAHSIKGMAASMGYGEITELAHGMEDLMDHVRKKEMDFHPGIADLLLEGADLLEALLSDVEQEVASFHDIRGLLRKLSCCGPEVRADADPPSAVPPAVEAERDSAPESEPPPGAPRRPVGRQTIRVTTHLFDSLINTTGELLTTKHRLQSIGEELNSSNLDGAVRDMARLLRDLHNSVMTARMTPFATIGDRLPRVVRDTARKSGKEAEFLMEGKGTELDRTILEGLYDPLVHVLRNAVDHGLETAEERMAAGKDRVGRVSVAVTREKDLVKVVVRDDGRGMDPARLVSAAVAGKLITAEQGKRLSRQEAFLLTCLPGFSTARQISDISGRGVGMDAVRTGIHALGGTLAIDSAPGCGSSIIFSLPLTVAIINVLLVTAGTLTLALPVNRVHRIVELRRSQVIRRDNRAFMSMDGADVPLLSLGRICGAVGSRVPGDFIPAAVTEIRGRTVALAVDRLIGQREVFVKPVGNPLDSLKGLAGGVILGDGEIVFILDVANLL